MRMTGNFAQLLHAFFHEWLAGQRNNSATRCTPTAKPGGCFSVSRLRDSSGRWPALRLADLTATEVLAFLDYSEKERHVSIGARNCRLAALGSFFCFVADREPLAAGQCAEVLRIPTKRGRAAASVIRNLLKSRPFWLISALQIVPDHCCLRPSPGLLRFLCSGLGLMRKNPRYPSGQERSRYAA